MTKSAMEQTRYWTWARRKIDQRPPIFNSPMIPAAISWEEQAFAEDSAGLLGGCVWPPRSYSCSFCRREFRSAQALGGHMNVHRRDRAKLKQSSSSTDESSEQYPDQVSTLEYCNPNPNPNSGVTRSSLSSASGINESLVLAPRSFTNTIPVRLPSALELKLELGNWKVREVGSKGKIDWDQEEDEIVSSSKKRRTADTTQVVVQSEVLDQLSPSHDKELDLELRLGDSPNIK